MRKIVGPWSLRSLPKKRVKIGLAPVMRQGIDYDPFFRGMGRQPHRRATDRFEPCADIAA